MKVDARLLSLCSNIVPAGRSDAKAMLTNRLVHLRSRAIDCRIWRHTGNHSKRSNININIKEETNNMVLYLCLSMRQEHTHTQEREQKAYLTFVIVDQQHTWALFCDVHKQTLLVRGDNDRVRMMMAGRHGEEANRGPLFLPLLGAW